MRFALGAYEARVAQRVAALVADKACDRIWERDATFWGGDGDRQRSVSNRLGWLDVASQMRGRVPELEAFTARVKADGFNDAVLLGMGGSSLAPEVLRQSIADHLRDGAPRLHVLDTTDPATILAVREHVDPARTLFVVSSKSGTTIEALSLFAYFHALVEEAKPGRAGENFVAVTDAATPLEALARQHNFRHIFTNPGDIGGRYSVLSYFGLAPAAVAGVDVAKLLDRGIAAAADTHASAGDALRLGAALGELALAGRDKCTFVVSPRIASFGLWVEQLIAESTGKEGRGILPVASEPFGTPADYGDDRLFVQLRLGADSNGAEDALTGALAADGHPVIVIDLDDVYDLGREFFAWEFAVAVVGHVLGINPFDEPNVQESKDNTSRVLKEFEASGTLDAPFIRDSGITVIAGSSSAAQPSLRGVLEELFEAIAEGDYLAVTAYVQPTPRAQLAFDAIRTAVRDARHVATTLGYAPRFLHSTGQLHKGGPPRGSFLQVTVSDQRDITIPGKPFTFGQLKRAQSIGDFQSLVSHGRPVARVHLGTDIESGLAQLTEAVRIAATASAVAGR
jgi:transaldolase/glucose-6-phosphate isomerase